MAMPLAVATGPWLFANVQTRQTVHIKYNHFLCNNYTSCSCKEKEELENGVGWGGRRANVICVLSVCVCDTHRERGGGREGGRDRGR